MSPAVSKLPRHLKNFVVTQDYSRYTSQEHATWRFIMRQNKAFFKDHAVPIYIEGLAKTGIPIDRIPNISQMDACLSEFGYGAVGVCGFIPPAIFLEFQALGIMPIATDMRTVDHVGYTPAPDIVHEAAGHAPIVADPDYRNYLGHYGQIAHKALFSTEDVQLYEAIRYLSDIKENPDMSPSEIERAQELLNTASGNINFVSESTKVGRMGWWTIEYGLAGAASAPKIYGAGLLSSVAESQACLSSEVKKIPLSVDCVEQSFDITEPQPQLFIIDSLNRLPDSLTELDQQMSYHIGGAYGLKEAIRCATLNTVELDSGIQASGVVDNYLEDQTGPCFFKLSGPSQLCHENQQLTGHDQSYHGEGFSSPIGRWKNLDQLPQLASDSELRAAGIEVGKKSTIHWHSGFELNGVPTQVLRSARGELLMISFKDCTVKRGAEVYFDPAWGNFDLAVGTKVSSVFSGPSDRDAYGDYAIGQASSTPGRLSPFSDQEKRRFELYSQLRNIRQSSSNFDEQALKQLDSMSQEILSRHQDEWLLMLELLELSQQNKQTQKFIDSREIERILRNSANSQAPAVTAMIDKGIELSQHS
jgi:phenylalanine-4-hydroxylase